jgi:hypothetical protein
MDFFQWIYEWFTVDLYAFVEDTVIYLTYKLIWMRIKFLVWFYGFAWSVASLLIADLQLAIRLSTAVSYLSPTLQANLEFFKVFTGLTWMLQAFATRFTLKFLNQK